MSELIITTELYNSNFINKIEEHIKKEFIEPNKDIVRFTDSEYHVLVYNFDEGNYDSESIYLSFRLTFRDKLFNDYEHQFLLPRQKAYEILNVNNILFDTTINSNYLMIDMRYIDIFLEEIYKVIDRGIKEILMKYSLQ